jgi:hypothetical protein
MLEIQWKLNYSNTGNLNLATNKMIVQTLLWLLTVQEGIKELYSRDLTLTLSCLE